MKIAATDRACIKGPRSTLRSHREHRFLDGRRSLDKRRKANRWLNTAYLLKDSFGQLWGYQTKSWARAFVERRRPSLRGQRLTPYEKVAAMIAHHGEGIASYGYPATRSAVACGGLNNKIHVRQRRAYGYRDEDYLTLKIVAGCLPPLTRSADKDRR